MFLKGKLGHPMKLLWSKDWAKTYGAWSEAHSVRIGQTKTARTQEGGVQKQMGKGQGIGVSGGLTTDQFYLSGALCLAVKKQPD